MIPCASCGRHLHATTETCPFCSSSPSTTLQRAVALVGVAMTPVVLAACYGAPPSDDKDVYDSGDLVETDTDVDCGDTDTDCS